mgnify:CR=1 FL=1
MADVTATPMMTQYRELKRRFPDHLLLFRLGDFYEIFYRRGLDPKIKIPKAVEASFGDPQSDDERAIKALIDDFNDKQATKLKPSVYSSQPY